MRINRLQIENFRRIGEADIVLEPATFLVGPNNTGKSSVISALDALLSLETEKLIQDDIRVKKDGNREDETVITGYITDIPSEVASSRGFKGRIIDREFVYRKTLSISNTKPLIETRKALRKLEKGQI